MKKVGILLENLFNEEEFIYPYHRLKEDFEVIIIGSEKDKTYTSENGVKFTSDIASKDVDPQDLDALFIPGGYSPDYMRRCQATIDLVKEVDKENKTIAAICHGPWMLASCIDLKGKDVTSFYSIKDDLVNAGANWIDEETVVSENILTARIPKDLSSLVKAFVEKLS
ncbi:type 1 glutamine amidotransferase domain-containing protein [Peptoniphilus obesi]|uniref:type 1 glutamine amidotransferase domain-containing protein n=1 Tax=Peptoniphilus obesi TaxID=1472765 RepID=UPI0004BC8E5B|nr:type 1 glutamine amidotransferase domain-containing protein [Peptoniphilus obesi]